MFDPYLSKTSAAQGLKAKSSLLREMQPVGLFLAPGKDSSHSAVLNNHYNKSLFIFIYLYIYTHKTILFSSSLPRFTDLLIVFEVKSENFTCSRFKQELIQDKMKIH